MKSKFLVGTGLIMIAAALCHRLSGDYEKISVN